MASIEGKYKCLCSFVPAKGQIELWMEEFDVNMDGTLSEPEFLTGITKWAKRISKENWLRKAQQMEISALGANNPDFWAAQSTEARKVSLLFVQILSFFEN